MNDFNTLNRRTFIRHTGTLMAGTMLAAPVFGLVQGCTRPAPDRKIRHVMVAGEEGRFMAWPANNGFWSWDDGREILVGYADAPWDADGGFHLRGHSTVSRLARSTNGGENWMREDPDTYVGREEEPTPSPGDIDFKNPDFALRVATTGGKARFFFSYDRGKTWKGSYWFNELNEDPNLEGLQNTARTSYLVTSSSSCLIFMSAQNPELQHSSRLDKTFVAETTDGGKTFQFISWVVPWTDQYRAVMPSAVRTSNGKIIIAARRRNPRDEDQPCWIDSYVSEDNGRTWSFLSIVGETGLYNGNPAALSLLSDGRLACCYGNRSLRQILVRFSNDHGVNWSEEIVIRDNPLGYDIGYPQIVQNAEGEMVAVYYLATEAHPHSYIEAAIWKPE